MPTNVRPVDAPDILLAFAGFSACFDRLMDWPVTVSPSSVGPVYGLNAGKRWKEDEDDALIRMYAAGASYAHMGRDMGRTASACQTRLYMIGYGRA